MTFFRTLLMTIFCSILLLGCSNANDTEMENKTSAQSADNSGLKEIEFEKYTLDNGLDVILHVDQSDPVVAIDLTAHVGSGRELPGKTGFAHLFEHLLFLDSENLGYGGLDEMNTRIGGQGTNGYTTRDVTKYFQAVPKDALEKIIWAEADKIGYFVNTVTENVVAREKQVVKNEKRQRVDNVPYGHSFDILGKAMYPADHPYSWQVIGSLADLEAASAADAREFYKQWYAPNNVTVTLAGDFDIAMAKKLIEKYFGEIPAGDPVKAQLPRVSVIKENQYLYYADNFAKVPRLYKTWVGVPQYHPDSYAIDILTTYLTQGKRAPLNQVLIDEEQLTSSVTLASRNSEISGEIYFIVDAKADKPLAPFIQALNAGFARFEDTGISQKDLDLIKAGLEVDFYQNIQSALGKAIQLGEYNAFTNDPGTLNKDIQRIQAVSREDVMRVFKQYIKDQNTIHLSVVPKGEEGLALADSTLAAIVEEAVVPGAEKEIPLDTSRNFTKTASSFDRTVEPEFGAPFKLSSPTVWEKELANGIELYGIENSETPLVYFNLSLNTGRMHADINKPAVPSLTAELLEKGTATKTTAELEDAIKALGSSINVSSSRTRTSISGSALSKNFAKTITLVEEMLTEPRWDKQEFALLQAKAINDLAGAQGSPRYYSGREWPKLFYSEGHIYHSDGTGSKESLESIQLDDLQNFYTGYFSPINAKFKVVGDVSALTVEKSLASLVKNWSKPATDKMSVAKLQAFKPEQARVYFYDIPGAKQSILNIGRPSLSPTDRGFASATAVNYLLGNIYTSRLNTELRVNKGYTYGIRSRFGGIPDHGIFSISSSVRSNATLESIQLIRDIVGTYGETFTEDDLAVMKSALTKGQALKTETLSAKLSMLDDIAHYDYAHDHLSKNAERVNDMTLGDVKSIANEHFKVDEMVYLIVGDADSQLQRLDQLMLGEVVLLNPDKRSDK